MALALLPWSMGRETLPFAREPWWPGGVAAGFLHVSRGGQGREPLLLHVSRGGPGREPLFLHVRRGGPGREPLFFAREPWWSGA